MVGNFKTTWVDDTLFYVIPQDTDDIYKVRSGVILPLVQAASPPSVHVRLYGGNNQTSSDRSKKASGNKRKTSPELKDSPRSSPSSDNVRDLKRLKSVGTDQMSLLSLESPVSEHPKEIVKENGEKKNKKDNTDNFSVPDQW